LMAMLCFGKVIVCSLIYWIGLARAVAFWIVLALLVVSSLLQAIADGLLYKFLGAQFPPWAIQAVQSGGTICFVLTFIVRIIAKAISNDTPEGFVNSGFAYFGFIVVVQLTCGICILVIKPTKPTSFNTDTDETRLLIDHSPSDAPVPVLVVTKKIFPLLGFLSCILLVSHMIYPGLTSIFHTIGQVASHDWFVVILFGCYCIGDLIGKNLPIIKKLYNFYTVWIGLAFHILLGAACIFALQNSFAISVFHSDWYAYLLLCLVGISNGYIMVCGYMSLPEKLSKEESGVGSTLALCAVYSGLFIGTLLSFLLKYIAQKIQT